MLVGIHALYEGLVMIIVHLVLTTKIKYWFWKLTISDRFLPIQGYTDRDWSGVRVVVAKGSVGSEGTRWIRGI